MLAATWNVNSVQARLPRLCQWLERRRPDLVFLQETKTRDASFPHEALAQVGYHAVVHGQPAYNGVALLVPTNVAFANVERGLDVEGHEDSVHARLISAEVYGVTAVSVYVPNGKTLDDPKCAYKLAWLRTLRGWLDARRARQAPLLVAGDYNVARFDADMKNPERWTDTVLYHPSVREALAYATGDDLVDLVHKHNPEGGVYTWWDYRRLGFAKDNGVRIDHLYASPQLACRSSDAGADRDERKGERPSDHVPAWCTLAWP